MVSPAGTQTDPKSGRSWRKYALLRPNGTVDHISEQEFADKYEPVSDTLARAWWDEAFARIPKMRTRELHLIGGAVLGVWRNIQSTGAVGLEVLRVPLDNGGMVGIEIPNAHVAEVLKALGVGRELVDPKAIFAGVVEQGEEVQLAGGLKLRRTMVHREPAFEIADAPSTTFAQLRGIPGVIEERIDGKLRFFIPTDPAPGQPVLDKLVEKFPVIGQTTGGPVAARRRLHDVAGSPTYNPKASLPSQAREARAEVSVEPGYPPVVMLNRQAFALIGGLSGFSLADDTPNPLWGITFEPAKVRELRRALTKLLFHQDYVQARERIKAVLESLDSATADETGRKGQAPAAFVNPDPRLTEDQIADIRAEEQAHYRQAKINGTFNILPTAKFMAHPAANAAADYLEREMGYDPKHPYIALEIGARLMWGGDLGLSREERKRWLTFTRACFENIMEDEPMKSSTKSASNTAFPDSRKPRVIPAMVQTKWGPVLGTRAPLPKEDSSSPEGASQPPSKP